MTDRYAIYPAVGVARVGNKDGVDNGDFFLAPDEIGGLPKDYDPTNDQNTNFSGFKDDAGLIRRQAQRFRVYVEGTDTEITIGSEIDGKTVQSLEWTVHLANKKSEWYTFSEQKGNLLYGTANSYQAQIAANPTDPEDPEYIKLSNSTVIKANPTEGIPEDITPPSDRHQLLIDPGPRTISEPNDHVPIDRKSTIKNLGTYPGHFPPRKEKIGETFQGSQIDKLGDLKTDSKGRLLVLGGLGKSQGQIPLDSYGGADTWYDDISDGSVTCTIKFKEEGDKEEGDIEVEGKAWVIVGPPDFAPELVNITSWDDTTFDVGVRHKELVPEMYDENVHQNSDYPGYNPNFEANYERDILPIIKRISGYQWVANVQSMSAFFANLDDLDVLNSNPSPGTVEQRKGFFKYFRKPELPVPQNGEPTAESYPPVQYDVFENQTNPNIPLMPLNSGSNSVSNYNIKKFMALTQTQHFLLRQWAYGCCTDDATPYQNVDRRNRASVGNVVGLPQCPGIEVTWTTQNPAIYEDNDSYRIKHADSTGYFNEGLSVGTVNLKDGFITDFSRDECETDGGVIGGESHGCQPGDLTKRMAIPWQADFFNCTIQYVNFDDKDTNKVYESELDNGSGKTKGKKGDLVPKPPTYYSYWWPPQAPWDVLGGDHTVAEQDASGIPAGLQVNYMRGINSYSSMVNGGWSYLAFIRNQNANDANYPYFVETERDHSMFTYESKSIGEIICNPDDPDTYDECMAANKDTEIPIFSLAPVDSQRQIKVSRMGALGREIEEDLFKEIKIAASHHRRAPRSGTKVRF